MTSDLKIRCDTPENPDVQALLIRHFDLMRSSSPEDSCHVMRPEELLDADAVLLSARRDDILLGVGALKTIAPGHGELKSMHIAQEVRGQGVGRVILDALIEQSHVMGLERLSLETGTAPLFAPARALYTAHGFSECPPFGDYRTDPFSVFMTRSV